MSYIKLIEKKYKKTFNYSDTNWGTIPIISYYTNLQGFELEFLIENLAKFGKKKNLKILDLGCGGGNVAAFLKNKFPSWSVYGIDVSSKAIKSAKENFKNVKFIRSPAEKLPFKNQEFDLVLSLDTLEHFKNYKNVILEVKRVLNTNALFYLAVPLEKQFPTPLWFFYKFGWTAKNEYVGHVNYFDNRTILSEFKNLGFINIKKTFGGHFIYFLGDVLYFLFLKPKVGKNKTFETSIEDSSFKFIKNIFSVMTYFESKIFGFLPGGRGHYFFKKSDFFSINKPHVICENLQLKYGLNKIVRPKDIYIKNHIYKFWKNFNKKKLLDFGCADGLWLERITKSTRLNGIGIDVSKTLIDLAKKRKNVRTKYFESSLKWPIKPNSIDYCISLDVFEHIKDRKKEIKNISESLKTDGQILFYTLNPNNKYTFDWIFEKIGSSYLYNRADHKKILFPNPVIFKKQLEKEGFKNVEYEFFDGPFNLFWDVATYIYLKILPFKSVFLLNNILIRLVYDINIFLDKITTNKGYSNGYFIWATKK